jgi:hypothetical protein
MQPYSSNVSPSDTTLVLITNALGAMLLFRDRGPSPWTPSRSWAGLRHTVAISRSGSQMVVVACARAWLAALVEYIDIHYAGCAVRVRLEPGHKNAHNRLFRFLKARGRRMSMCRVNSGTVKYDRSISSWRSLDQKDEYFLRVVAVARELNRLWADAHLLCFLSQLLRAETAEILDGGEQKSCKSFLQL